MKYNGIELLMERQSLSITKQKNQQIRHYHGTDKNDVVKSGRGPTILTMRLIARNDAERILIEQILHDDTEAELEISNFKYKKVTPGESFNPVPAYLYGYKAWYITAEFIALDPISYDLTTGGALY